MIFSGMSGLGIVSKQHIKSQDVHEEVQNIIREQEERVEDLLGDCEKTVRLLAEELLEQENFRDSAAGANG